MHIQINTNQPNSLQTNIYSNSSVTVKADKQEVIPPKMKMASPITIATLSAVASICMLSRGFQKNASQALNKFKIYLEDKRDLSSIKDTTQKTKFYNFSLRRINSFIKKTESINNITSLKDILFMKLMYKTKPTEKIHKGITSYFEKISRQTVLDSYKKTEKHFDNMNRIFDNLDDEILKNSPDEFIEFDGTKYTKKDLVKKAKEYRDTAMTIVSTFMSKGTIDARYKHINDVTSNLYSSFWDASFKDFWSKDNKFKRKEMWQTFIAADQIKGDKTSLATGIIMARNALTCSANDKSEILQDCISKLDDIILPNDFKGIEIIGKLKWFAKYPDGLRNNRDLFLKELQKLKEHKINSSDTNLAKTQELCKKTYIELIENFVNDDARGELQDMLSIYYKIAPFELDKYGAFLSVKKAVKSFDKSVELESVEFFDKVRDLRLGSAPTDVLTILLSFITLSFGLGYAKDNDKRQSIMLKSGIPVAGGIATAIYSATKLVSGGKSLALGFLSGIILNQLGKIADNIRKNHKELKTKGQNAA